MGVGKTELGDGLCFHLLLTVVSARDMCESEGYVRGDGIGGNQELALTEKNHGQVLG